MALVVNQILAYRISAEVKRNIYKEKKTKLQIEAQYMNLAQSTFHKRKNCPQNFCLLAFKEIQSEFFQGINPACEIFLLLLKDMKKE